jgi:hypothetical protein
MKQLGQKADGDYEISGLKGRALFPSLIFQDAVQFISTSPGEVFRVVIAYPPLLKLAEPTGGLRVPGQKTVEQTLIGVRII